MKYWYPHLAKRFDISIVSSSEQSFTSHLLTQFALYLLFFILTSIVFVIIARQVSGQAIHWTSTGPIVVLFSVAWVIGFITPGAPGGIGVREALLLFLLTPVIGEEVSLRTAFWFRGVTILGDGFFFGYHS